MPRYKTSDGRVITIGEIYKRSGGLIEVSDIKTLGSDIFPYPLKFNSDNVYCYDFNPKNCKSFSLLGSKSNYPITAALDYATSTYCEYYFGGITYGTAEDVFNIFNNFSGAHGNSTYLGGILPLYQIFVYASESPGHYTSVFLASLTATPYEQKNYYSIRQDGISAKPYPKLLAFLNNVENQIAEPDSSPVADDKGVYDNGSDIITLPGIDSINVCSALQSSGVKAHKLAVGEVNKLFTKLWSTDFFDSIIKNQQAPIDNILSMSTYPYDVHGNGINEEVSVGTVAMGATGELVTTQFQEIDFGSINCEEYYGNSLDYTYTDVDIYLPFIGTRSLDINIIGGSTISLVYRVDILTGNCDAIISAKRSRDNTDLNSVLYIFSGNMQNQIPLTQQQNQSLLKLENAIQTTIQGAVMGNPIGGLAGGVAGLATEGMTMALTGQPTTRYQMSGNLSTANGYMGVLTPYLIWYRPINIKPNNYNKYYGYPSFFTKKLSDCSGYTQIHELISDAPTGVPADDWEKIKQMLKDGIIIN